jgi:uncharacterized protein (DUF885 family)
VQDRFYAEVTAIDARALWGMQEWVMLGYLRETLVADRGARACRSELWPAHQFGWQMMLMPLLDQQPVGNAVARGEALARWQQFPRYLDREIANLREGIRLGYTTPKHNIELALRQLDAMLADPDKTPLVGPAHRDTDPAFVARWTELVTAQIVPAIRRYRDYLATEYLPHARTTIGVRDLPDGAACYRGMLRAATTTDIDPAELFRKGEARVAEREAKTIALARELYGITDLRKLHDLVEADPNNHFKSGEEIVQFARAAVDRAEAAAPRWFGRLPKARIEIKPYADFEVAAHQSARYEPAPRDGSHAAYYRIDATNVASARRLDAEDTAFHEAFPGHHLQLALQRELGAGGHEIYDLGSTGAFVEGWARYTESLADEMHLYSSPLDRLGAVAGLPTGMVVDPGIHAIGWTRDQAVEYYLAKQIGETRDSAESYVDRIAVWPAQMVTYGYGELAMLELRARAEHDLGARFDIKAFHDHVLAHGALPLTMLREVIERWIAEAR